MHNLTREDVDSFNPTRCPDTETSQKVADLIAEYRDKADSIGGTVTVVIRGLPAGLGEPCFDKLEAKLAHAMMSIPATKGFEIGSGFAGTEIPGSRHNDMFEHDPVTGKLKTKTNYSGGIQGGISNGQDVYMKIAFKSPATIGQPQATATYDGKAGTLAAKGRHDPCVVSRAVPIVEAMAAIAIMDSLSIQAVRTVQRSALPPVPQPGAGIKTTGTVAGEERKTTEVQTGKVAGDE